MASGRDASQKNDLNVPGSQPRNLELRRHESRWFCRGHLPAPKGCRRDPSDRQEAIDAPCNRTSSNSPPVLSRRSILAHTTKKSPSKQTGGQDKQESAISRQRSMVNPRPGIVVCSDTKPTIPSPCTSRHTAGPTDRMTTDTRPRRFLNMRTSRADRRHMKPGRVREKNGRTGDRAPTKPHRLIRTGHQFTIFTPGARGSSSLKGQDPFALSARLGGSRPARTELNRTRGEKSSMKTGPVCRIFRG